MMILAIDPGRTTGWALYDTDRRAVVDSGQFPEHLHDIRTAAVDHVVIERPKGQGPTRPEMVECGITFGRLIQWAESKWPPGHVHGILRYEVKSILSAATHGEVNVRNDATAWAALKLLHGDGCDRKARTRKGEIVAPAGPLGTITSHERAAVAAAVAWAIDRGVMQAHA